jgi:hypothetical protein
VHQLPAGDHARRGLVQELRGGRARGDRRAHPRIRLRARRVQREAGAARLHITYPVALDNNYTTWNNFGNDSWPAEYLVDASGEVRHVAIGEGDYSTTESLIRQLLTAAHPTVKLPAATDVPDTTPDNVRQTPETYLGLRTRGRVRRERERLVRERAPTPTATRRDASPRTTSGSTAPGTSATRTITSGANAGIELELRRRRRLPRRRRHRDDHGHVRREDQDVPRLRRARHLHRRQRRLGADPARSRSSCPRG